VDLPQFLDRMVAPGNFLAVAFKSDRGLAHRFFPRADVNKAAGFLHWASDTAHMDTWYSPASYKTATLEINEKTGKQNYKGERTQANVELLKSFWFDADIKRDGDNKDPARVFASVAEVAYWAKSFSKTTGIPMPNVWVRSGYGVHLYWTFADAIDRTTWQPYADALKAALVINNAKGDVGVVGDSARILRPIGTFNYKADPVPCFLLVDF
jgi:hypothetical protein